MAKVTLVDSEFDADNEEIKIRFGRAVAQTDRVALSARMSSGRNQQIEEAADCRCLLFALSVLLSCDA